MILKNFSLPATLGIFLAIGGVSFSQTKEAPEGYRAIFDGISLTGWNGDPNFWSIENGAIVGQSTEQTVVEENTFLIWSDGELDDFDLKLSFKIESGNSGVQVRSFLIPESEGSKHAWRLGGYQADIEAGTKYPGLIYGEKFRGILAKRGEIGTFKDGAKKPVVTGETGNPDELLKAYKLGEWNTMRVVAKGHTIEHYLNGQLMAVLHDEDTANRRRSGLLGFQMHKGAPMKVHFKDIFLKRLPMEDVKKSSFSPATPVTAWISGLEIPAEGLVTPTPDEAGMKANLDPVKPKKKKPTPKANKTTPDAAPKKAA